MTPFPGPWGVLDNSRLVGYIDKCNGVLPATPGRPLPSSLALQLVNLPRLTGGPGEEANGASLMVRRVPGLATLVTRVLVGSIRRYRCCLELLFPALVALMVPIQMGLVTVSRGVPSPADRLPASLFALQLTILSILTSYAFLPRVTAAFRKRALPKIYALKPGRRALTAAAMVLVGASFGVGPGRYALPALAFAALFLASWPWVKNHAKVGYRLIKQGLRLWRRRGAADRLAVAAAFVLAQAAPLALGKAAAVVVAAVGGPEMGWATQVMLAAGLVPVHLLIFVTLGASLRPAEALSA